jgi:diguanylate cyclase (GGDEF)-like protein/PAS domain S-box-containing protein
MTQEHLARQAPPLSYQAALIQLALHDALTSGDLKDALPVVVDVTAYTLGVERVSVWFFTEDRASLDCWSYYRRVAPIAEDPMRFVVSDFPTYFQALQSNRTIDASDAQSDPRTLEFTPRYLRPLGILSTLDAPIRREGKTIGLLCAEATTSPRRWRTEELHFMASVADLVAMCVEREQRRETERFLQKVLQTIPHMTYVFDIKTQHNVFLNKHAFAPMGYSDAALDEMGNHFMQRLLHPDDVKRLNGLLSRWDDVTDDDMLITEYRVLDVHGRWRWFRGQDRVFKRDEQGQVAQIIGVAQEITDEKRAAAVLKESESRYRTLFDAAGDALLVIGDERIIDCNMKAARLFNAEGSALTGRHVRTLIAPVIDAEATSAQDMAEEEWQALITHLSKEEQQWRGYRDGGEVFDAEVNLSQMMLEGRQMQLAIVRDVTERNRYIMAMEYQATHDSLTGLPNRKLLYDHTAEVLERARHGGSQVAMLLIDLDHFKEINDTLGHHSGDLLLKQIGPRLTPMLENGRTMLARLGGDEFAVLLPDIVDGMDAKIQAERLLCELRRPYDLSELRVEIGGSVGVALYPEHGEDVSNLLRCADIAMYHAKKSGIGVSIYDAERNIYSLRRLSLITELGAAIRSEQLTLFYQPLVSLGTRKILGFEALLRWQHPRFGLIPPTQFIPLAEMGDMIQPLTQWVLERALDDLEGWQEAGFDLMVSVNLSSRNLSDHKCLQNIQEILRARPEGAKRLSFELTESALIADPEHAQMQLDSLHQMGIRIAIDDFGTGYSSLVYLRRLPISSLKIDLSFVRNMLTSANDRIIVDAIVQLAHKLSLSVVAEGVEDQALFEALLEMGCDVAQGYYISRPIPAALVVPWLQNSPWQA